MKVTLLSCTPDAEKVCVASAKGCYSTKSSKDLIETLTPEKIEKTLNDTIGAGHGTVLEHAVFTFSIEGVSRALTHQLVRHRIATFHQQSQRYVDIHKTWENMVIPRSVGIILNDEWDMSETKKDEHMLIAIENYQRALKDLFVEMDKHNIPSEDMRYFVPQGTKTSLTMTMNARELLHFFELRCCNRAQWEIRDLADKVLKLCKQECPLIFALAGPGCVRGKCQEGSMGCKHPRTDLIKSIN